MSEQTPMSLKQHREDLAQFPHELERDLHRADGNAISDRGQKLEP